MIVRSRATWPTVFIRCWASGPIANGRPPWYSTRRLAPAIASARCCTRTGSGPIRADALRATAGPRAGAGGSSSVSDRRHADRRQHTHMLSVTGPEGRAGAGPMRPGGVAASGVRWGALPPRGEGEGRGRGACRPAGGTGGARRAAGRGRRRVQLRAGAAGRGRGREDRAAGGDVRRRRGGRHTGCPADRGGGGDAAGVRRAAPVPAAVRRSAWRGCRFRSGKRCAARSGWRPGRRRTGSWSGWRC